MSNPVPAVHTKIEMWSIDKLVPYSRNTKEHTPQQVSALARLMREGGFDQPIVVDEAGVIVKGHGRRLGAIEAGLTSVPVIVLRGVSPEKVRAIRIGDNKVAEGKHDKKILKQELADLIGDESLVAALCISDKELKALMPELGPKAYDTMAEGIREVDNFELKLTHQVVVEVPDEAAQFALVERLRGEGFKATMQSLH